MTTPPCPRPRGFAALAVAIALVAAVACGGGSPDADPPIAPSPTVPTITITAAGVSPKVVEVPVGGRVRFVNAATTSHMVGSDPHPDHTDCPDINQVGFLLPGQSRETGNFVQPRTCGFHDHDRPDVQGLRGTITIR